MPEPTPLNNALQLENKTLERFLALMDRRGGPSSCWTWTGRKHKNGSSGRFTVSRGPARGDWSASHLSFALAYGKPGNRVVRHLCGNNSCVNPAHLSAPLPAWRTIQNLPLLRNAINIPQVALERFLDKIDFSGPNGCWLWTAHCIKAGYGHFRFGKQGSVPWRAHRLAYSLVHGEPPDGLQLHHECSCERCVNPDHLRLVTPRDHAVEFTPGSGSYIAAHKTHCIRGHEFTPENTRYTNLGKRVCVTCNREWMRQRYARWRAANPMTPKSPYCPHGHLLEGDNVRYAKTASGGLGRQCRVCARERARERAKKH